MAAEQALIAWAASVGQLQAATSSVRNDFAAALASFSPAEPPLPDGMRRTLAGCVASLERELPRLGVRVTAAARGELLGLADALDDAAPGAPAGLVPGDTCPDNGIVAGDRLVLLDLEAAEHRHVAWEAAYLTVPWPSCWCSWRLPPEVTARAVARWREELAPSGPVVTTTGFTAALTVATTGWVMASTGWLLPNALDGDPLPPDPQRRAVVPRRRAMIQHRLALAADLDCAALPALQELAEEVHQAAVAAWGAQSLALAPAFR